MINFWRNFFRVLAIILVIATLVPILPKEEWYIRLFDFPRLQIFVLALMTLFFFYIFDFRRRKRGRILLILLIGTLVYQAFWIYPYTPLAPYQSLYTEHDTTDTTTISLLISNVLQSNTRYEDLIKHVQEKNPDIVLTTEADKVWQFHLDTLKKTYPYTLAAPQGNTYGMLMYSRFPLRQARIDYRVEDDIPSMRAEMQLPDGSWIQFFGVHPRPPAPSEASDSRERDAEIVLVGEEAKKMNRPVIVAGDFNDVAWSPTTKLFQEVSGLLDPRIGRGYYNTFNANIPVLRWPLDHVFYTDDFKLVSMEVLEYIGSDHFPVYVQLSYEPAEQYKQEEVKPEEDTKEEAQETIQEGLSDTDNK